MNASFNHKILGAVLGGFGMFLAAALPGAPSALARELTDATGVQVALVDRPSRVVTLIPSLGELAAEVLGEDLERIVGVSEYTDYPPAIAAAGKRVTSIGPYTRVDLEKILALKPDLVLASTDGNSRDQIQHLRELKIPVVVVKTESLGDVESAMRLVADAIGSSERGRAISGQFAAGLARIRARGGELVKSRARPLKVLLQLDDRPLVVVGKKSFLHDALGVVGAENIYGDAGAGYPRPALEDVIRRNPDVIVVIGMGGNAGPFKVMASRWEKFPSLSAVKNKRIRVVDGDSLTRPTLRLLEGLSLLERALR